MLLKSAVVEQLHRPIAMGVNGVWLRFASGPPIILLHGFPQDWYEWRHIMPRLAKRVTVIAIDLRGIGGSETTRAAYEITNLAEDVHQLVQRLRLERVYVAGPRRRAAG